MAYLPNSVREKYLLNMDFQRFNERTITSRKLYERVEKSSDLAVL